MTQVTMTGKEYEDLLRVKYQYEDIIGFLEKERKVTFTPDNIDNYHAGDFHRSSVLPAAITDILVENMVEQLLDKSDEEFALWASTEHHYYDVRGCELNSWLQEKSVDLLEYSSALRFRWDTFKAAAEAKAKIEEDTDNE